MKKSFLIVVLLLVGVAALAINSAPNTLDATQVREHFDTTAENMLLAINQDDYDAFISDFDQTLKTSLSESDFHEYSAYIKSTHGRYRSKNFVNAFKSEDAVITLFAINFTAKDGYMEITFSKNDGSGPVIKYGIYPPISR